MTTSTEPLESGQSRWMCDGGRADQAFSLVCRDSPNRLRFPHLHMCCAPDLHKCTRLGGTNSLMLSTGCREETSRRHSRYHVAILGGRCPQFIGATLATRRTAEWANAAPVTPLNNTSPGSWAPVWKRDRATVAASTRASYWAAQRFDPDDSRRGSVMTMRRTEFEPDSGSGRVLARAQSEGRS